MAKTEVIVDTCFLHKLSSEGKKIENIERILSELDYIPVIHPYVYEHEFSLHSYLQRLVDNGYIRLIRYDEFIKDANDKQLYESYYSILYEDLRTTLEAVGSLKQIEPLKLFGEQTIYNTHKQGSSMGDVHLMLMANFMKLPVVLTQDSDVDMLRSISKKRMKLGSYSLEIYDGIELIKKIARKTDASISVKEIEKILNDMGERKRRAEIKEVWREFHPN